MINFILTAMAIASITLTVGKSYVFRPIRNSVEIVWLKKLLSCPYCLAHWVSLLAVIFIVPYNDTIDFVIKTMALVTLSSIMAFIVWLYILQLDK